VGRRRWRFARVVVAVQAVAGLVLTGMFLVLGLSGGGPDRTAFDRTFPFAVAAAALLLTVLTVGRGLRRIRRGERDHAAGGG